MAMKRLLALISLTASIAMGATDPAGTGPYSAARMTVRIPGTQGATLSTDLYFPGTITGGVESGAAPCPLVVLGHGFSQSKARHVNQGLHLGSRGFVVLIPNFKGGSDHARNGEDIRRCIDWALSRTEDPGSILYGCIDARAIGVSGHSAGGLSAILAAAGDTRIRAVSVMDPVDNRGQGVAALPNVRVPIAMTWSEPSACNANGSAAVLYAAAAGIRRGIKVVGANHTDPQDPAGLLSSLVCGSADAARQSCYRRYMVGWFERYLRGDTDYDPYVYNHVGGQLATDLSQGIITYQAVSPLLLEGTVETGNAVFRVSGPAEQRFAVQVVTNGSSWTTTETSQTEMSPVRLTNLPPANWILLRTESLP
jgi:dienelactone hydrolase